MFVSEVAGFTKDSAGYPEIEGLRREMLDHRVPYSCKGCAEIPG